MKEAAPPTIDPAEPPWRMLQPRAVAGYVVPLAALSFVAVATGLGITGDDLGPPLIVLGLGWIFLRSFMASRRDLGQDTAWLASVCEVAFFLRVLAAIVIYAGPWDRYLFSEDQQGYDYLPETLSAYWTGIIFRPEWLNNPELSSRMGYYGLVAIQYYIFGSSFFMPRVVNCLAGALMTYYSYRLGVECFGRSAGRITAVWVAVFPSLILWSSLNMRDIWLSLSVVTILWHALRCRERIRVGSVLVIALNLVWLQYTRSYLVIIMLGALAASFLPANPSRLVRDFVLALLFGAVIIALRELFGVGRDSLEWLDLDRIARQRNVLARADVGMSGYLPGVDLSNPLVMIPFLPLAIAYFLYSPFPWQLTAFRRLVTLPDMMVWYWMMPSLFATLRATFRLVSKQVALLMASGVLTLAFSVSSSNVGLAYRYRAQVIAPLLVLTAAGYLRRRQRKLVARPRAQVAFGPPRVA